MSKSIGVLALASLGAFTSCAAAQRPDGGTGLLSVGSDAPDLSAVDQNHKTHRLAEERGHPVVIYFYPKDSTPGCTKEACAFRDTWDAFQKAGVTVFGVSADDEQSHEAFAKEQRLPFPILSDPTHTWMTAFGVSRRFGMASRVSILLDAQGKVAKVYPEVDPAFHAAEVLKDAAALPR